MGATMNNTEASNNVNYVDVTIHCDVHGEYTKQVASIFKNSKLPCFKCIEEQRAAEIEGEKQRFVDQLLNQSGLPKNSIGMTFRDVDREKSDKQTRFINVLIEYVKSVVSKGSSDGARNLMLTGNMGTGKTLFASIVLQNIARRSLVDNVKNKNDLAVKGGLAFKFISEQMLLDELHSSWKQQTPGTDRNPYMDGLCRKAILCIDDVGTVASSQHLLDAYSVIFDERYKRGLPTIITTNMSYESLALAIGARCADRFFEHADIFEFSWSGYRQDRASAGGMRII